MVFTGSELLNTKLPATNTSAPASLSALAFDAVTPPSISMRVDAPLDSISVLSCFTLSYVFSIKL